ncbi:TetR/AcrR family transcriptional regulator [Dactylosporangium sp. McL0621]|uniref:TetR/AcrR family transcriptional regulator n=1 Tax=Dactylosporangium sp. McL0621 TaxID=3415678 RepID=UPI003CFAD869
MPERPTRRLLAAPERAASILTAAARVFARQGYAATTVDQVAAEAGVSKLIVYRHFNSKRELYLAIITQVRQRLANVPRPTAPVQPEDGLAAIRHATATLAATFAVARELPDAFRLLHRHAPREPEFAEHAALHGGTVEAEAMLAGIDDPLIRGWMARIISKTVDEAFLDWLDAGDPDRDDEMVERVAFLLGGMVGSAWVRARALGRPVDPPSDTTPPTATSA